MVRASVVIPARGRAELLVRVLRLLDGQQGPAASAFETIVVADHCPDTVRAVTGLELAHRCRLFEIPGDASAPFGAAEARNLGARFAEGELLIFLDADCLVGPDHVAGFLSVFEAETLLIGPIDYVSPDDWTKPLAGEGRSAFAPGARAPEGVDPKVWLAAQCWTGNLGIERRAFLELGGFDLGFMGAGGEDVDFGLRCVARFGRVALAPSRVRHVGPTAAFAHARGEPGPLESGGVSRRIADGRYERRGDELVANGGRAFFGDGARWRDVRDLRAGRTPQAPPAAEGGPSVADVFQAQLERSAAALVAIARRLDRTRPLAGGEDEFLALYAGLVAADPEVFSRVWSDPQAHAWAKAAFEALERVERHDDPEACGELRRALDRFAPFALACAHLSGRSLPLRQGLHFAGSLALPGTVFTLEAPDGAELVGVSAGQVFVELPGGGRRSAALERANGGSSADVRVAVCPTLVWRGETIRLQPSAFRGAVSEGGEFVVDAGAAFQADHVAVLRDALGLLERFHPDAARLAEWLQVVAFNPPEATGFGNTSSSERPGALAVMATRDAWELAETLVHELYHQRLFAVEIEGPLFADAAQNAGRDFRHYSPWRIEPRPMKGLVHALYVFVEVARHWLAVLERSEPCEKAPRARARARLSEISLQLPVALDGVRGAARFSPIGERLFRETARACEDVLVAIGAAGVDPRGGESERTVEAHRDQFEPARALARLAPRLRFAAARSDAEPAEPGRSATPRVSALCVTRGRVRRLERAVRCFLAQTHPDRELVVVHDDDDLETVAFVDRVSTMRPEVAGVRVPRSSGLSLGELRNLAVERSTGDYVCQWDDDDWHHPERIAAQLRALSKAEGSAACVLSRWIVFDEARGRAYLSPYRQWEGSLLCRRDAIPRYPALPVGEDTPVVEGLRRAGRLVALERPELYVYVAHGGNTFPESHFETYYEASLWLGAGVSAELTEVLAKDAS